jgi:hypothetical protein
MNRNSDCTLVCVLAVVLLTSCTEDGATGSNSDLATASKTESETSAAADDDDKGPRITGAASEDDTKESPTGPHAVAPNPASDISDPATIDTPALDDDTPTPADDPAASLPEPAPEINVVADGGSFGQPEDGAVPDASPVTTGPEPISSLVDAGSAGSPTDAGEQAVSDGGRDVTTRGVQLRAVLAEVSEGGMMGIAAEWSNGTDQPIFLQGCSTTSGWYLEDGEWQEYGGFILCFAEGPMVVVSPGEIYVDFAGVPPSDRGTDIWRLQGPYGVGCMPAEGLFSESECAAVTEITSVNEVSF